MRYIARVNASAASAEGVVNTDPVFTAFGTPVNMGMEFITVEGSIQQVLAATVIQMISNRRLPFRLDIDHLSVDNSTLFKLSLDTATPLDLVASYVPSGSSEFFPKQANDLAPLTEFLGQWPSATQYLQNIQPAGWVGYQNKLGVIGVGQCEPNDLNALLGFDPSNLPPINLALELLGHLDHVTIVRDAEGIVKLETQLPPVGNPFVESKPELVVLLPHGV